MNTHSIGKRSTATFVFLVVWKGGMEEGNFRKRTLGG